MKSLEALLYLEAKFEGCYVARPLPGNAPSLLSSTARIPRSESIITVGVSLIQPMPPWSQMRNFSEVFDAVFPRQWQRSDTLLMSRSQGQVFFAKGYAWPKKAHGKLAAQSFAAAWPLSPPSQELLSGLELSLHGGMTARLSRVSRTAYFSE